MNDDFHRDQPYPERPRIEVGRVEGVPPDRPNFPPGGPKCGICGYPPGECGCKPGVDFDFETEPPEDPAITGLHQALESPGNDPLPDQTEALTCSISKEVEFDAGHRVPNHKSKCRNPHGHRYKVRVTCSGKLVTEPEASDEGMLIDFSDLKTLMTLRVHDVMDHGFIVYTGDKAMLSTFTVTRIADTEIFNPFGWKIIQFPYIPTAENIARWIWEELDAPLMEHFRGNLRLKEVAVWETPTSVAYWYGG